MFLKVVEEQNECNEVLEKYVWVPLQEQWARQTALVLVTSILVGAILLSVMLPLMNIMTAIG